MKTAKAFTVGNTFRMDDELWIVTHTMLKSRDRNNSRTELMLKNVLTGSSSTASFQEDDELEDVILHRKKATLMVISGDSCMFMDTVDSAIFQIDGKESELILPFLEEGMVEKCVLTICEDKVVGVQPPMIISRKVAQIENPGPGASSGKVMAKLQNGTGVQVDDSVRVGDVIDIDPSDGSFLGLSDE